MQFYFLLPLLLIFVSNKILPWLIGVLIILLTGYSTYEILVNDATSSMYFSLLARMPEFFIGSLLSIIFMKRQLINERNSVILSTIGLLAIFGSSILINEETLFPGITALIPTIGTGFLLISNKNIFSNLLSKKPMVHIGELSYSLYLWHWPIMALMRYHEGRPMAYDFSVMEILFISITTYALAWLSYTFIENTFRTTGNKQFVYVFSPVLLLLAIIAYTLPILSSKNRLPREYTEASFGRLSHGTKHIEIFGDTTLTYSNIFLFGDSHALNIKPFLDHLGKKHGFSFRTISTNAFLPIAGIDRKEVSVGSTIYYDIAQSLIDTTSKEVAKSDVIIVNSIDFERFPSTESALDHFAKNLRSDQSLIILNTFPIVDRNPARANKAISKITDYDFKIIDKSKNKELLKKIAARYENVHYYDISKSRVFDSPPFYNDILR